MSLVDSAPVRDVWGDFHDEPLWGLGLTAAGVAALDLDNEDGDPVIERVCVHPAVALALVDDSVPLGDPDAVVVCGACGAEHAEGRWSA